MLSLLKWDPIGIGDLLTGVLIGLVLFPLGVAAFFVLSESLASRRYKPDEEPPYRRPVTRGVLICDWVDLPVLTSVAKQKNVEPEPIRLERGEGTAKGRGIEGGSKSIRARMSRETREDSTAYYELPQDANTLLGKVLGKLDDTLRTDLDEVWEAGLLSDDRLDQLIRTAKATPQVEAARDAVRAVQTEATKDRLLEVWRQAAQEPRFALVETVWRVEASAHDPEAITLTMEKVRHAEYRADTHYGNPPEVPTMIACPGGITLAATVSRTLLTEQGKGRLVPGAQVKAGVFGVVAEFEESSAALNFTPTAIFARVEG